MSTRPSGMSMNSKKNMIGLLMIKKMKNDVPEYFPFGDGKFFISYLSLLFLWKLFDAALISLSDSDEFSTSAFNKQLLRFNFLSICTCYISSCFPISTIQWTIFSNTKNFRTAMDIDDLLLIINNFFPFPTFSFLSFLISFFLYIQKKTTLWLYLNKIKEERRIGTWR